MKLEHSVPLTMESFALYDFPMPPSLNASYKTGVRPVMTKKGRKMVSSMRSSDELIMFKNECVLYIRKQRPVLEIAAWAAQQWVKAGHALEIHLFFCWPEADILTQTKSAKNKFRRLDADNRIKATVDGVSQCLGIDDSNFTKYIVEKVILKEGQKPCVMAKVLKTNLRTSLEILTE